MWKQNKTETTLQDVFSRKNLEKSLNSLSWTFVEDPKKGKAWEMILRSGIESVSPVLSLVLFSLKNQTFGKYTYYFYSNRIERTGKSIKPKTKFYQKFKLSSPIKIKIKKKTEPKGLVSKIE